MSDLSRPKSTPRSYLTLSVGPALFREDAQAAAVIEYDLDAIDGGDLEAVDRLIGYVWPFEDRADRLREYERRILEHRARQDRCDPAALTPAELASVSAERDWPIVTEAELRLLDGNR